MDSTPSQTSASNAVVTEMHKEGQQATSSPTSLRVTREARASPQLNSGNDALSITTSEVDPGISAPSTDPHVLTDKTRSASDGLEIISLHLKQEQDLDSLEDDPITMVDDSEEDEEEDKNIEIHSTTNDETKDIQLPHLHLQGPFSCKNSKIKFFFSSLKSIHWKLRRQKLKLKSLD
nr:hypothetical protein [Tanacetum cinerariifolium]